VSNSVSRRGGRPLPPPRALPVGRGRLPSLGRPGAR
jgi:hypothetical protein